MRLEEKRSYRLNVESWEKDGFLREDTDLDLSGGELLHAVVTAMIHMDISEVVRMIVSNGMILYALTRDMKGEGSR